MSPRREWGWGRQHFWTSNSRSFSEEQEGTRVEGIKAERYNGKNTGLEPGTMVGPQFNHLQTIGPRGDVMR